jgi:hypothetical protein
VGTKRTDQTLPRVEGFALSPPVGYAKDLTRALKRYVRDGRVGLVIETDNETSHSALLKIMDAAKAAKVKRRHLFHEEKP